MLVVILTLTITYGATSYFALDKLKFKYTMLEWPSHSITLDSWWQQQGDYFPLYRVNRFGLSVNVFNVQWLDDLNTIQDELIKNGWEVPPKHDWLSILYRISSVQSTEHLPLVSPIYLDKRPELVLIKYVNDNQKLVILRLWKSQFLVDPIQQPLWLGSIEHAPSTYSWLFKRQQLNDIVPTTAFTFYNASK